MFIGVETGSRLSYTPVRRQENLAPSRDQFSLSFSAK